MEFLNRLHSRFGWEEKDLLGGFRKQGWQQLLQTGLPEKSHEAFRYVPLRELYLSSFETQEMVVDKSAWVLPECAHSHIVFVDGVFSPALSDISAFSSKPLLSPLDQAMRSHSSFLQSYLSRSLKEEKDPFALLNLALHRGGAFFYLPPKAQEEVPLQVIQIASGFAPSRLHLVLGAGSKLRCIATSFSLNGASSFLAPSMEIALEENASLELYSLADGMPQGWHMESVRATLKGDARFSSLSFSTGGKAFRQSLRVQLKGSNAEAHLSGLWMLEKNHTAHFHATVDHEAPHTRSMQRFKGVLSGASQSSFEGKILVREAAQKTEAYQINNNLLLSQGAVANSKPNLEVFADDVKASHGATVSQLDAQQLFYLKTRGIDEGSAKRLLVGGFARALLEKIPFSSVLQKLLKQVETFSGES